MSNTKNKRTTRLIITVTFSTIILAAVTLCCGCSTVNDSTSTNYEKTTTNAVVVAEVSSNNVATTAITDMTAVETTTMPIVANSVATTVADAETTTTATVTTNDTGVVDAGYAVYTTANNAENADSAGFTVVLPQTTEKKPKITCSKYVVKQGDSLWSIAERSGCSYKELLAYNGISEDEAASIVLLPEETALFIPPTAGFTVVTTDATDDSFGVTSETTTTTVTTATTTVASATSDCCNLEAASICVTYSDCDLSSWSNIETAANALNGYTLYPGQSFHWQAAIGNCSYVEAPNYFTDSYEYAGGIDLFGNLLYNVANDCGLESYYSIATPQGLMSNNGLSFRNSELDEYIVFETAIDAATKTIEISATPYRLSEDLG